MPTPDNKTLPIGPGSIGVRLRQVAADAYAPETAIATPESIALALGRSFDAGQRLDLGAGGAATWTFANPADSGRIAIMAGIRVWTTAGPLRVRFVQQPTSYPLGEVAAIGANFAAPVDNRAVLHVGAGEPTGGTALTAEAMSDPGNPYQRNRAALLPPGMVMSMIVSAPAGLTGGATVAGSVQWAENDL